MAALADPATIRRWREQPPLYVRERFGVEPDPWQDEVLADFPRCQRQAMQACKGPGKTALEAWLGWNFLETRPHPKIGAISITKENLRDNLWAEMAKWQQRSDALKEQFVWTGARIFYREYPETWFMSARAFAKTATAEEQSAALAGLHADYIMFLIDESGAMPPPVVVTAEAALSSCKEGHVVQAGNTLSHSGALYGATKAAGSWKIYEITGDPNDPKRSPRVSIEWAQEQIARWGRDNPYVMVNVLGKFAPNAINSLLSLDEVEAAVGRQYREDAIREFPRILGGDVARQGDDASVIFPRQGLQALTPKLYRNIDSVQGANAVAQFWQEWDADACFIDDSGGYGSGWIDNLGLLGYVPIGVQFAGKADDPMRYVNKRAEMHFRKAQWVKRGGQIPPIPELIKALSETTYTHQGDKLLIEPKDQLKVRLGFSPDHDDALALTFAYPVARRVRSQFPQLKRRDQEWDPIRAMRERDGIAA